MKLIYFLIAGLIAFSACTNNNSTAEVAETKATSGADSQVRVIASKEAKELLENREIVILDVRTPDEYAGGHLQHALNLNINEPGFEKNLAALDRDKTYLVYCAVGGRSHNAAEHMQQLGFKQVYDATGGFKDLKNIGIPTE